MKFGRVEKRTEEDSLFEPFLPFECLECGYPTSGEFDSVCSRLFAVPAWNFHESPADQPQKSVRTSFNFIKPFERASLLRSQDARDKVNNRSSNGS